jgi:hypothetical protein
MSWDEGDFNYDGNVNGADFVLLSSNFNQHTNAPAAVMPTVASAAVSLTNNSTDTNLSNQDQNETVASAVLKLQKKAGPALRQTSHHR